MSWLCVISSLISKLTTVCLLSSGFTSQACSAVHACYLLSWPLRMHFAPQIILDIIQATVDDTNLKPILELWIPLVLHFSRSVVIDHANVKLWMPVTCCWHYASLATAVSLARAERHLLFLMLHSCTHVIDLMRSDRGCVFLTSWFEIVCYSLSTILRSILYMSSTYSEIILIS